MGYCRNAIAPGITALCAIMLATYGVPYSVTNMRRIVRCFVKSVSVALSDSMMPPGWRQRCKRKHRSCCTISTAVVLALALVLAKNRVPQR
jgi:hypothetical protein